MDTIIAIMLFMNIEHHDWSHLKLHQHNHSFEITFNPQHMEVHLGFTPAPNISFDRYSWKFEHLGHILHPEGFKITLKVRLFFAYYPRNRLFHREKTIISV